MSTGSPRFRSGNLSAPTSDRERLERALGDGERAYELLRELTAAAARTGNVAEVVELTRIAERSTDPQRAYAATRSTAQLLVTASRVGNHEDHAVWAPFLDAAIELLVPALERNPHEPELLDLLGLSVYELGHTSIARRVFERLRDLEPEHPHVRAHLRACKQRAERGAASITPVDESLTPSYVRARPHVKRLLDRWPDLEPRTISLVMIVKDEEEMLPGCLAAVAEHVDQMVVVDTGSSDRTREIAAEYGAEVHEFEWNGSFSDARNESLRHATGDWVLWLDADEHLVGDDGAQLRELARKTWIEGFHVVETHYTGLEDHGSRSSHAPMRMFQRRAEYRWRGKIHEQILDLMPTYLEERFQHTTVRVDHYGYLTSVIADRSKRDRNLELLMAQLAERRDAFTCCNIGTEYAAMGDHEQARSWFEEALSTARAEKGWQERQFAPMLVQRTVATRRHTGDIDGAVALAEEALQWWPEFTDLVYERALAHIRARDWQPAAEQARRALTMGDAPARFVSTSGKGSFQARSVLASALVELGDVDGARAALTEAVREAPHFLGTATELVDLIARNADPQEAVETIDELLGDASRSAATGLVLGAVFHEAGANDQADEFYERVLTAQPGHAGALVAQAELRLAQGRFQEAYDLALGVDPLHPMAGRGGRTAFLAAVVLAEPELLEQPAQRIAADEALPAAERAVYVAWRQLAAPGDAPLRVLIPADQSSASAVLSNLEALAKLEATDAFEALYSLTAQVLPDEQQRRIALAELFLRRRFADLAGEQLVMYAERFGPTAQVLLMLGKVATIKELWDDAEVFLTEALELDPQQHEAARLLHVIRDRNVG